MYNDLSDDCRHNITYFLFSTISDLAQDVLYLKCLEDEYISVNLKLKIYKKTVKHMEWKITTKDDDSQHIRFNSYKYDVKMSR